MVEEVLGTGKGLLGGTGPTVAPGKPVSIDRLLGSDDVDGDEAAGAGGGGDAAGGITGLVVVGAEVIGLGGGGGGET